MRKQRIEPRRAKLPPILEIDEDGLPVNERETWIRPHWSSDEDVPGVALGEWPADLDD